jgi:hypothetical protein
MKTLEKEHLPLSTKLDCTCFFGRTNVLCMPDSIETRKNAGCLWAVLDGYPLDVNAIL